MTGPGKGNAFSNDPSDYIRSLPAVTGPGKGSAFSDDPSGSEVRSGTSWPATRTLRSARTCAGRRVAQYSLDRGTGTREGTAREVKAFRLGQWCSPGLDLPQGTGAALKTVRATGQDLHERHARHSEAAALRGTSQRLVGFCSELCVGRWHGESQVAWSNWTTPSPSACLPARMLTLLCT